MNAFLRRPGRYLVAHWTITLGLAVVLLVPAHQTPPRQSAQTLTLLTGQVVRLGAGNSPLPQPGLREGRLFDNDQYAVPAQILGLTGSLLDPRLFDVSYLEANGYGDAARSNVPVIVSFANHDRAVQAAQRGWVENGIHLTHVYEYGPFASGYVDKHGPFMSITQQPSTAPGSAEANSITGIFLDAAVYESPETITPSLYEALPLIGAPAARERGLTGQGVKVAVVDTGIDDTHPDLKGRVIAARDFTTDGEPRDQQGHGTHVAGIIGGTGAASDGKFGGVAPQVQLINAKGLSRFGSGTDSGIMNAMEWAADQGARVINMSLGGGSSNGTDPLSREVNTISEKKNVLFVIAAGNSGPSGKVSTPAAADRSLAVGAIDKSRELARFSSRGPRIGDRALKPDVVAPGVAITAPRANFGTGEPYVSYSGTSMASPMVAGAAALVVQLHPTWTAQQVKDALMSTAQPIGGTGDKHVGAYDQGAGLISLSAIVNQVAIVEPASLSFGEIVVNKPREGQFTLRNLTDHILQLRVSGHLIGPKGVAAGTLSVSPSPITLQPGGSAAIRMTIQPGSETGNYSGDVIFNDLASGTPAAREVLAFVARKG